MKIYVGNLTMETAQPQIRQTFEEYGDVAKVSLAVGTTDGARKGFGFVEMLSEDEANAAISGLNGQDLNGNALSVREARPGTYKKTTDKKTTDR